MKKFMSCIVVLLAFALAAHATPVSTPLYMVGGEKYFEGVNTVSNKAYNAHDISAQLRDTFSQTDSPKAMFVFEQSGLTTTSAYKGLGAYGNTVSLPNLKASLESSSLSLPYTYMHSNAAFRHVLPSASVSTRAFSYESTCDELSSYVTSAISAAGSRPALILATSTDSNTVLAVDKCLNQITTALSTGTQDEYILSVMGSPAHDEEVSFVETSMKVQATSNDYPGPLYVTAQTVYALTITFFLLITAWIGFQCTLAIETPVRQAHPYHLLPATKEY